jgi:hypothetical protein
VRVRVRIRIRIAASRLPNEVRCTQRGEVFANSTKGRVERDGVPTATIRMPEIELLHAFSVWTQFTM